MTVLSEAESRAVRHGVPDPGIPVPSAAAPTLLLYVAALGLWVLATWLLLGAGATPWLTVPVHAAVSFSMFTVLHEATHHAAGRLTWVNELFGRLAQPFVAGFASFPAFRHIHIEHHRNTNESSDVDPDAWTTHGPTWQLPLRWVTQDFYYAWFWAPRLRRRPRAEVIETLALAAATVGVAGWAIAGGWFWQLAVIYLIPQRIGITVLAWWFDWLPHHGLTARPWQDRFRATRVRVGAEWLLTPIMLYQNYHLVHHLHPAIPFYRYLTAWQRNEDAYLANDSAIMTAWGKELSAAEYRAWRSLTRPGHRESAAEPGAGGTGYSLRVADVRPLTEDSVVITFAVPDALRATFGFVPGQHLTVHVDLDGVTYRRTYSICSAATSDVLRIAVKRIPGGRVSEYLSSRLERGERIGVQPPAGRFTLTPNAGDAKHYVGVVAGSGITPLIAMASTSLLVDSESRFTLIYGSRTPSATMFADELRMLERQFDGRLRVLHHLSGVAAGDCKAGERARPIDPGRVAEDVSWPVDEWFLCGPQRLVSETRDALLRQGVPEHRVHIELFHPELAAAPRQLVRDSPTAATAMLRGAERTFDVDGGQSVLDAALDSGVDAPYACHGGACGTCRAKLVTGDVELVQNLVLSERDRAAGYILTCQSYPTSDRIEIDYDM